MGCYRNNASLTKIAIFAGVEYRTVDQIYRRVIIVIQRNNLCVKNIK